MILTAVEIERLCAAGNTVRIVTADGKITVRPSLVAPAKLTGAERVRRHREKKRNAESYTQTGNCNASNECNTEMVPSPGTPPSGPSHTHTHEAAPEAEPEIPPNERPLPAPVSRELAVANCGQYGVLPEVAGLWWDDRDSVGWRNRHKQPIHHWHSNMKAFASRFDSNERERASEMEKTRKEITARMERRAKDPLKASMKPDKWGKVEPNSAAVKEMLNGQAKAHKAAAARDAELKSGEKVSLADITAASAELRRQLRTEQAPDALILSEQNA